MSDPVRWELSHTSAFTYEEEVAESQNELRSCPTTDDVQTLLHHRATITPGARVNAYVDYWGTRVETFGVRGRHGSLEVVSESTVLVGPRPSPPEVPVSLDTLAAAELRQTHGDLLAQTALVAWGEPLAAAARTVAAEHDDVWALAVALRDRVAADVELLEGRQPVGTPVEDVLADAVGGPRDRAHLLAGLARAVGIPARYVSGHVVSDDVAVTRVHAWVEVWVPGHDWHALDPSGDVGQGHVTIGRGRDHGDVPPLRGAYLGSADHELTVTIEAAIVQGLQSQMPGLQQQDVHGLRQRQQQGQQQ
jgi:transglutaminase-like putative cysteine protease